MFPSYVKVYGGQSGGGPVHGGSPTSSRTFVNSKQGYSQSQSTRSIEPAVNFTDSVGISTLHHVA
jgi:hypothetical protein